MDSQAVLNEYYGWLFEKTGFFKQAYIRLFGLPAIGKRFRYPVVLKRLLTGLPPSATVLDVGAGLGEISVLLACPGRRVTAVDFVAKNMSQLQSYSVSRKASVTTFVDDLNRPSGAWLKEQYDSVVCLAVLDYLVAPNDALDTLVRLVKAGGTLVLGFPLRLKRPIGYAELLGVSELTPGFELSVVLERLEKSGIELEECYRYLPFNAYFPFAKAQVLLGKLGISVEASSALLFPVWYPVCRVVTEIFPDKGSEVVLFLRKKAT